MDESSCREWSKIDDALVRSEEAAEVLRQDVDLYELLLKLQRSTQAVQRGRRDREKAKAKLALFSLLVFSDSARILLIAL